jgi:hypothetical protein
MTAIKWWQWAPIFPWRVVAEVEAADEVPEKLPRNGVVLVGSTRRPKWLAFDCPCRTGHRITIPLDPAHTPHWTMTGARVLSVHPSVDYRVPPRRCHYFIRQGHIVWARDTVRVKANRLRKTT